MGRNGSSIRRHSFLQGARRRMGNRTISVGIIFVAAFLAASARAQPTSYPAEGQGLPAPLPLFPSNNWWNVDVSAAPLDVNSQSYINFINQPYSSPRGLHPDFGGQVSPGSTDVYGIPFAVVLGTQPRVTVIFDLYSSQSDGVGQNFYPIPIEAETQPYWIEGGPAGNVDLRGAQDRHLLVVDRDNDSLYELYNVWFDGGHNQWHAGSGAFWDMKTNNTRPLGWTSADAAGLQILPGLVRYDEAYNAYGTNVPAIGHAFRVTVRSTNGYVYPASHVAGNTAGALPMGARLRLKASTPLPAGSDAGFTRIFNALKKYGLIVADNGSDMYITGTYDVNWNNDVLNPLFGALTASDFEVVQLGWTPPSGAASLSSVSVNPASVIGGSSSTGTVGLNNAAPSGGALVALSSSSAAASVPASVKVAAGATSATFPISTAGVSISTAAQISGTYSSVTKTAILTVNPPPPAATRFYTLTPCRILDTRNAAGPFGAPSLAAGATRTFVLAGQCGIPADAKAVSVNITVVPTSAGALKVNPAGATPSSATAISFAAGRTLANNGMAFLGVNGDVSVEDDQVSGTTDLIIDTNGYFK